MFYVDVDYEEWGGTFGTNYNTTESYGPFESVEEATALLNKFKDKYEFEEKTYKNQDRKLRKKGLERSTSSQCCGWVRKSCYRGTPMGVI